MTFLNYMYQLGRTNFIAFISICNESTLKRPTILQSLPLHMRIFLYYGGLFIFRENYLILILLVTAFICSKNCGKFLLYHSVFIKGVVPTLYRIFIVNYEFFEIIFKSRLLFLVIQFVHTNMLLSKLYIVILWWCAHNYRFVPNFLLGFILKSDMCTSRAFCCKEGYTVVLNHLKKQLYSFRIYILSMCHIICQVLSNLTFGFVDPHVATFKCISTFDESEIHLERRTTLMNSKFLII